MNGGDTAGRVIYDITANLKPYEMALGQAEKEAQKAGQSIEESFTNGTAGAAKSVSKLSSQVLSSIRDMAKGLASISWNTLTAGAATALTSLTATAKKAIADTQGLEAASIQMQSFTGSLEKGNQAMAAAYTFFKNNPFNRFVTVDAVKNMVQFGAAMEDIPEQLKILGDISLSTGADLSELASIYQRSLADNKIGLMDLEVLANRGVPVYKGFQEALGMTASQVRELTGAGELTGDMLKKVFKYLSDNAGPAMAQFEQTLARQQDRMAGGFSNLRGLLAGYTVTTNGLEIANNGLYGSFVALETEFVNIFRGTKITAEQYENLSPLMKKFIDDAGGVEAYSKRNAAVAEKLNTAMTELGITLAEILVKVADKLPGIIDGVATVFKFLADHSNALIPVATMALVAFGKIGATLPGVGGLVGGFAQSINLLTKGMTKLGKVAGGAVLQKLGLFQKTAETASRAVSGGGIVGGITSQASGAVNSAGGLAKSLISNNSFFSKAASAAGGIVAFAGAMVAVAGALRLIYELFRGIDLGGLIISFGITGTAMAAMAVMAGVMGKFKTNFLQGAISGVAVVAFAAEIAIVAAILRTLPDISEWGSIALSALAAVGAFSAIAVLAGILGIPVVIAQLWMGVAGGAAVVAFSAELLLAALAFQAIPTVDLSKIGNLAGMIGELTVLGALMAVGTFTNFIGMISGGFLTAMSAELKVIATNFAAAADAAGTIDESGMDHLKLVVEKMKEIGGIMQGNIWANFFANDEGAGLAAAARNLYIIVSSVKESIDLVQPIASELEGDSPQILADITKVVDFMVQVKDKINGNIWANFFANDEGSAMVKAAKNLHSMLENISESFKLIDSLSQTLKTDMSVIMSDIDTIVDWFTKEGGVYDKINGNIWANWFANDEGSAMAKAAKNLHTIMSEISESLKIADSLASSLTEDLQTTMSHIDTIVNWFTGEGGVYSKLNGNIWANWFANDEGTGLAKAAESLHTIVSNVSESLKIADELAQTLKTEQAELLKDIDHIIDIMKNQIWPKINGSAWDGIFSDEGEGLAKAAGNLRSIIENVKTTFDITAEVGKLASTSGGSLEQQVSGLIETMKKIAGQVNNAGGGWFSDNGKGLLDATDIIKQIAEKTKEVFENIKGVKKADLDKVLYIKDVINNFNGYPEPQNDKMTKIRDFFHLMSESMKVETMQAIVNSAATLEGKDWEALGKNLEGLITAVNREWPDISTFKTFFTTLNDALANDVSGTLNNLFTLFTTYNTDKMQGIVSSAEAFIAFVQGTSFSTGENGTWSVDKVTNFKTFFQAVQEALRNDVAGSLGTLFEIFNKYNKDSMSGIVENAKTFVQFIQGTDLFGSTETAWDSSKVENFKTFFQTVRQALKGDVASSIDALLTVFNKFNKDQIAVITDNATNFVKFVQGDDFGAIDGNAWTSERVENFKTFFQTVREALDNNVSPAIESFLTTFNKEIDWELIKSNLTNLSQITDGKFGENTSWNVDNVTTFRTYFDTLNDALDNDVLGKVSTFVKAFQEGDYEKLVTNVENFIKAVNREWPAASVGENLASFFNNFNYIEGDFSKPLEFMKGMAGLNQFSEDALKGSEAFVSVIQNISNVLGTSLLEQIDAMSENFKNFIVSSMNKGFANANESITTNVQNFVNLLYNTFYSEDNYVLFTELGNMIVLAIGDGMLTSQELLTQDLQNLVNLMYTIFYSETNYLLLTELGNMIIMAIGDGMLNSQELLTQDIQNLVTLFYTVFYSEANYMLFTELGNMVVLAIGDGMINSGELIAADIQNLAITMYNTFYTDSTYALFTELGNMMMRAIGEGMIASWALLQEDILAVLDWMANEVNMKFWSMNPYNEFGVGIGSEIGLGMTGDGWNLISGDIDNLIGWMSSRFNNNRPVFEGIGRFITQGVARGLTAEIWRINLALGQISSTAVNKLKSLLGIHSPSKVFYELGEFMGEGLANGISDMASEVVEATENMVRAINTELDSVETVEIGDKISTGLSGSGSTQNIKNITLTNNNNISNGLDASSFMSRLMWDMQRA